MQQQQQLYIQDNKVTDLYIYFNRPSAIITGPQHPLSPDHKGKNMDQLTYTEFINLYCWDKKLRSTFLKAPHLQGYAWWKITLPNRRVIFITKRLHPDKCIVRMNMIYPSAGEIYYLRLLLLHNPARSFKDLLHSVDDNDGNKTFQECCLVQGLLHDHNEAIRCFEEAMIFSSPRDLRNLFVIQTLQGFPTEDIFNNPIKRKAMSLDFIQRNQQGDNSPMAMNELLTDLALRFQAENRYACI